jgi:predicted XRE-type DNA-binding protein
MGTQTKISKNELDLYQQDQKMLCKSSIEKVILEKITVKFLKKNMSREKIADMIGVSSERIDELAIGEK